MKKVIWQLGDDVSTDVIYPGRYMATVLPTETPPHAFADLPDLNARLRGGSVSSGGVLVSGENFGCGSSREQAVSCLKGHEVAIVAKSFARIFLQNAVNLGLHVVVCPTLEANEGDELEILSEEIENRTNGRRYKVVPLPPPVRNIVQAGGLINYARERLLRMRRRPA